MELEPFQELIRLTGVSHANFVGYSENMTPISILCLYLATPAALHLRMEQVEPLPASWRGLMLDLQALRNLSRTDNQASGLQPAYKKALARLEKLSNPNADDLAERGGLLIRLGRIDLALGFLRGANAQKPDHPAIMAHLATAMTLANDLVGAEAVLVLASTNRPASWHLTELAHLTMIRKRLKQNVATPEQPATALATLQDLMLSFPADARLMWQASETATAMGDQNNAIRLLDIATGELGLRDPAALRRREALRSGQHEKHAPAPPFRSYRPLAPLVNEVELPPIDGGVQPLPWPLSASARPGNRGFQFPAPLKGLQGKRVRVVGYAQFLGDEPGEAPFLLVEQPFGCWWCERPDLSGQFLVELSDGEILIPTRDSLVVEGILELNANDPERHPLQIKNAKARTQP